MNINFKQREIKNNRIEFSILLKSYLLSIRNNNKGLWNEFKDLIKEIDNIE